MTDAREIVDVRYEPCVLGADGRCTRWSHDHDRPICEDDTLKGQVKGLSHASTQAALNRCIATAQAALSGRHSELDAEADHG